MIRKLRGVAWALALGFVTPASAETMTNADVIALRAAGVADEVILAKIHATPGVYDTSTAQLIALKAKGVSPAVMAAMIGAPVAASSQAAPVQPTMAQPVMASDPMMPPAPGVYLLDESGGARRLVRIDPTGANQAKSGGVIGYALSGGLISASVKAVIPGGTARTHAANGAPVFLFRVDQSGSTVFSGPMGTGVTPNDFSLIRLIAKDGRREARVGSMNIGGVKAGVMDKDRIGFRYDEVARGVYRVTPEAPLAAGEYGFLYQPSSAAGLNPGVAGAVSARVFDFSVGA
jgi:hypothetical protein